MYADIFRRFSKAVRRKRPLKLENQYLVYHSRQCSKTPVGFGQGFRSKEQCGNTGTSHILSRPACNRLLLVPSTEISIGGVALCDATSIIRNATEELKRLSQNGRNIPNTFLFAGSSVVAQNDCFEGNVASLIVLFFFCISQN